MAVDRELERAIAERIATALRRFEQIEIHLRELAEQDGLSEQ